MKNIKTFEQFKTNEEISLKSTLTSAALSAGLMFGSPNVYGQEIEPIVGKHGVDVIDDAQGELVKDKKIINGFRKLLQEERISSEQVFTLVDVYELKDDYKGVYSINVRKQNAKLGEEFKAYINKEDFDKYLETGEIDQMILYQFKEVRPIPNVKKYGL